MINIEPKELAGPWNKGFVLDKHTVSSTMIGHNEFGHPEFDTQRSPLGELIYRLKYKHDRTVVRSIAETVAEFVKQWDVHPDLIVPMPPSMQRPSQPLWEIGGEVSKILGIPLDTKSVVKTKNTAQMKDVGDYSERVSALQGAFALSADVAGKNVLLLDDLFQSGASMTVVTEAIRKAGASAIYALALTRTRS